MKQTIYIIIVLFIGIILGYFTSSVFNSPHYTFLKVPDTNNSNSDLLILDTRTGDIYKANPSDGYKNFEKITYNK